MTPEALERIRFLTKIEKTKFDILAIGRWANTRADIAALLEAYEAMREALETALDIAEQNVEDPDTVLIEHLKQTLGGNDEI